MPEDFDIGDPADTLGLQLAARLIEHLHGELELSSSGGVTARALSPPG
jgi:two-component sensor histidine kinase